ncbi:TPA: inositol monophosphatase family protein [Streptococcus suis]|nr:inositol monophosphatase family protein [Streptococcus suis]
METKLRFAQQIVLKAGRWLREHMNQQVEIAEKADFKDLVTNFDQSIQDQLSQDILQAYPLDAILGEESQEHISISKGCVWVLDPIDGTTNFIAQQTDFCILLAYFEQGVGQFALLYNVMADQLIWGGGEFPVFLNDRPLLGYQKGELKRSLLGLNAGLFASNAFGLARLANHCLGTRSYGSAGISFAYVLEGRLVAHASYLYPWDYAVAAILGPKLGYELLSLENGKPRFEGREYVLFLPSLLKDEITGYLDEWNYQ